jgi:hypothetical protein
MERHPIATTAAATTTSNTSTLIDVLGSSQLKVSISVERRFESVPIDTAYITLKVDVVA